jgi:hypothetical protein
MRLYTGCRIPKFRNCDGFGLASSSIIARLAEIPEEQGDRQWLTRT